MCIIHIWLRGQLPRCLKADAFPCLFRSEEGEPLLAFFDLLFDLLDFVVNEVLVGDVNVVF